MHGLVSYQHNNIESYMSSQNKTATSLKVFILYGNIQSGNILIHKQFLVAAKDEREAKGLAEGKSSVLILPNNMQEIADTESNVKASCILWESSRNEDLTALRSSFASHSS